MTQSYRDLFKVHLKYVDYLLSKSLVIHSYTKNIKGSGDQAEEEVRSLLRGILPARYRVTHGYIVRATSRKQEPSVSPQVDVIIVDTLVPHSLWVVDEIQGVEIVPVEAVLGVIEVKRTLTAPTIRDACKQLFHIRNSVSLTKGDQERYAPGGIGVGLGLTGGYTSNPLLGILGLDSSSEFNDNPSECVDNARKEMGCASLELDVVACLSGIMIATGNRNSGQYQSYNERQPDDAITWIEESPRRNKDPQVALARALGFILAYVSQACGTKCNPDAYFFNHSIADNSGKSCSCSECGQ